MTNRRLSDRPPIGTRGLVLFRIRMSQMPKTLVRRNQAFHIPPARAVRCKGSPGQHHFQDVKQLLRHLEIALITGMMKSDQYFVGQAPAIARCATWACFATDFLVSLAHPGPHFGSVG